MKLERPFYPFAVFIIPNKVLKCNVVRKKKPLASSAISQRTYGGGYTGGLEIDQPWHTVEEEKRSGLRCETPASARRRLHGRDMLEHGWYPAYDTPRSGSFHVRRGRESFGSQCVKMLPAHTIRYVQNSISGMNQLVYRNWIIETH